MISFWHIGENLFQVSPHVFGNLKVINWIPGVIPGHLVQLRERFEELLEKGTEAHRVAAQQDILYGTAAAATPGRGGCCAGGLG